MDSANPTKPQILLPVYKNGENVENILDLLNYRLDIFRCTDCEKAIYLEDAVRGSDLEKLVQPLCRTYPYNSSWFRLREGLLDVIEQQRAAQRAEQELQQYRELVEKAQDQVEDFFRANRYLLGKRKDKEKKRKKKRKLETIGWLAVFMRNFNKIKFSLFCYI